MKLSRAFALAVTAALLGALARDARAQDANAGSQNAAASAAAATASVAPKPAAPKKASGKPKRKSAKRKARPEPESKYKTRALTSDGVSQYRFDADGNPIGGGAAKKSSAPKARRKPATDSEGKAACSDDAPCSDRKSSDADAL